MTSDEILRIGVHIADHIEATHAILVYERLGVLHLLVLVFHQALIFTVQETWLVSSLTCCSCHFSLYLMRLVLEKSWMLFA